MQPKNEFEQARDELMSHIHRCGVLKASKDQQEQWFNETVEYMAERYTSLTEAELEELGQIGRRFCQPVIPHGREHTALTLEGGEGSDRGEMAGAA